MEKVWFEYEGIVNAGINPYQFEYKYPAMDYPDKYNSFENYGVGKNENPDYTPLDVDAWGNYQADGASRHRDMKPWMNQKPEVTFDPAAWHLKVIKLPSGGEIHVQYEQDDYAYIQDKLSHVMASLKPIVDHTQGKFCLNLSDLGIEGTPTQDQLEKLKSLIDKRYVESGERMYFKFLYKLIGDNTPELTDCNVEYIEGYDKVSSVEIKNNELWVQLGAGSGTGNTLPHQVCGEFLKTQRAGLINPSGDCNASENGILNGRDNTEKVMNLYNCGSSAFLDTCKGIKYENSYLRIPILNPKKGGGVRVKRLLMYDKGIKSHPNLYGTEYIYETLNELGERISSGVATNEPGTMREENILVGFLERYEQDFFSKIIAGRDKKQTEGPLGESILPAPSVGYSRVTIKNINDGKTNPGITVKEFYTAKDYPFKYEMTDITQRNVYLPIPAGLANLYFNKALVSQGFKFNLNNMHGQLMSVKTYTGDSRNKLDPKSSALVSSTRYKYFEPGEEIPVMKADNGVTVMNALDTTEYLPLGKEMDLIFESRSVKDINNDVNIEGDADVGIFGLFPVPFVTAFPSLTHADTRLYTHVTTKVIRYPSVIKQIESHQDGITHITENIAFDPHTGKPIVTKTYDGFHGLGLPGRIGEYIDYKIPASFVYENMGSIANDEKKYLNSCGNLKFNSGKYSMELDGTGDICNVLKSLIPGSFIRLPNNEELFHVGTFGTSTGFECDLLPVSYGTYTNQPPSASVDVEILRSGRTNQLNEIAGSFVTYGTARARQINFPDNLESIIKQKHALANKLNKILSDPIKKGKGSIALPSIICAKFSSGEATKPHKISINFHNENYGTITFTDASDSEVCTESVNKAGGMGSFSIDPNTGELVYEMGSSECKGFLQVIKCANFCNKTYEKTVVENAVSSSASTYNDMWPNEQGLYYPFMENNKANPYETGERGKWRLESKYAFNTEISGLKSAYTPSVNQKNYNSGIYNLELFNWKYLGNNSPEKWLKLNTITKYSPHGSVLEEENILGIKSAAKFGYNATVPYLVVKNSDYPWTLFESFENSYKNNTVFEDGLNRPTDGERDENAAHSGKSSLKLKPGIGPNSELFAMKFMDLKTAERFKNGVSQGKEWPNGMLIKVWVKSDNTNPSRVENNLKTEIRDSTNNRVAGPLDFKKVAQVGEWTLYESRLLDFNSLDPTGSYAICLKYNFLSDTENIWIDDVRIQPLDAQMNAYVYDVDTLRLLTNFDDQHFGLFYQYNAEGKLVRKLIETERGMKTVRESQYNVPLVPR